MSTVKEGLFVTSHVARDLLQSAGLFKSEKTVAWEYIVNSLQYVDPGTLPIVNVTLDGRAKRISVADNGRGMSWDDLQNFFTMHGENIDRKEGRVGRGRFGTGKSAAFGIGDILRVRTTRNGKRSTVEVSRSALELMKSGDPVKVRTIEREVSVGDANGTIIEIDDIHLKAFDVPGVVRFVERHLAHWRRDATVIVNNHPCEYAEPPISDTYTFRPKGRTLEALGDITLTINVAKSPLEPDARGVAIYSKGVWHESTLAGAEGREMSQYVFGAVDVPALDDDLSPIKPFDMSRNMQLNPNNELVREIYTFVGQHVEEIRRKLLEVDKARRATEEAKKMAAEAQRIASMINDDFDAFRNKLAKVKAKTTGTTDLKRELEEAGSPDDALFSGGDTPAEETDQTGQIGITEVSSGASGGETPRMLAHTLEPSPSGEKVGAHTDRSASRHRPRGGFGVDFKNLGPDQLRAQYDGETRMIYINLDHVQIAAARGLGTVDDPVFRRLAYEVAFTEYAVALAQELCKRGEYVDITDPIFDIRETINRVATRAASLYRV